MSPLWSSGSVPKPGSARQISPSLQADSPHKDPHSFSKLHCTGLFYQMSLKMCWRPHCSTIRVIFPGGDPASMFTWDNSSEEVTEFTCIFLLISKACHVGCRDYRKCSKTIGRKWISLVSYHPEVNAVTVRWMSFIFIMWWLCAWHCTKHWHK